MNQFFVDIKVVVTGNFFTDEPLVLVKRYVGRRIDFPSFRLQNCIGSNKPLYAIADFIKTKFGLQVNSTDISLLEAYTYENHIVIFYRCNYRGHITQNSPKLKKSTVVKPRWRKLKNIHFSEIEPNDWEQVSALNYDHENWSMGE